MAGLWAAHRIAGRASVLRQHTVHCWRHGRGSVRFVATDMKVFMESPNFLSVFTDGSEKPVKMYNFRVLNFHLLKFPPSMQMQLPEQDELGFVIRWSDSHRSRFTWEWLEQRLPGLRETKFGSFDSQVLWNSEAIEKQVPEVDYDLVMDTSKKQQGMACLTNNIRKYGFCFVNNTPVDPEATKKLLESIGPIQNTHYGGFWDFGADFAKADSAYSNAALDLHTDTTYFTDPAGIQAFHLLSHTPSNSSPAASSPGTEPHGLGGQSFLVDGFFVAHRLRKESLDDFQILKSTGIPWHCSGNSDVAIVPDKLYPIIESYRGAVHRIRWNNADRGVLPVDINTGKLIKAMRIWDTTVRRPNNIYRFYLKPGRVLIFDNWRILHARSAFKGDRRL
ncbi:hypothetical protein CP532_3810 [Ophiocordyceps camponoti-leonardi (nom. inval.)]|nr:hypothetical protein CP532_3810 [Ophiocordyceps camponoti-leonardi (nom. inval.)]